MAAMTSTMQMTRCAAQRSVAQRRTAAPTAMFGSKLAVRPAAVQARKSFRVRAEAEEAQVDVEKYVDELKEKWDAVENKTAVVVYGAGAVTLLWFSSTIVGAVNNLPLVPKLLELVGLGYTAWFTYRYLLFKSSREELLEDIEELKKKISGAVEEADEPSGGELLEAAKPKLGRDGASKKEEAPKVVRGVAQR